MHPADEAMGLGFAKAQEAIKELAQTFRAFKSNYSPVLLTHPPDRRDSRIQELHTLQKRLLQFVESANALLQSTRELKDRISYHHDTCVSARSLISALPVEVIRHILCFAVLEHKEPSFVVNACSAVCRQWRDIVLSEKDVWSSLTIHNQRPASSRAIERFASRSHSHTFHLKLAEDRRPAFSLEAALETPFVDNLRSITWDSPHSFDNFVEALNSDSSSFLGITYRELPNVQHVHVQGPKYCPTCHQCRGYNHLLQRAPWDLELYFPALTSLSLDRVVCVLDGPVISRLEHLSLRAMPFDDATYNVIFRHGSKLRTLEICELTEFVRDIREATLSSAARWPLQQLLRLTLAQVPIYVASFFMAYIDTPELETLALDVSLALQAQHSELVITNLANALKHTVKLDPSPLRKKS
ncbi:hypothetical protein DL93DRAFT_438129 [Clavulina sp. PMI_390]|nr:hypothetical protein DL93DRAFT_438129 [Clavulina sp. PMI_390]